MKKIKFFVTATMVVFLTGAFAQAITGSSIHSSSFGGARILSTQGNTAANPAIGFQSFVSTATTAENDGGGGNGIFRPVANTMAFSTASLERMRINVSGAVGIGTTNPTAKFHSVGTVRFESLPTSSTNTDVLTTDASGNISSQSASSLFSSTTGWNLTGNAGTVAGTNFIGTTDSADLAFRTNNVDRAVITSAGNLGIGTMTPTAKLTVEQGTINVNRTTSNTVLQQHFKGSDDDNAQDYVSLTNSTDASGYFIPAFIGKSDVTGWGGSGDVSNSYIMVQADDNQTSSRRAAMTFDARNYTNNGPLTSKDLFSWGSFIGIGAGSTYMSMDAQGKLGLGTTNPTAKFHSVGTARFESLPTSSTNTDVLTTDASGNISSQSASSLFSSTTGWGLTGNAGTVAGTNFIGTTDAADLTFRTNNVDRAVITSTGNMGIGNSLPTAKLEATSAPSSLTPALKGNGVTTGVYGEATDMILGQTEEGLIAGWVEAVGVFGKGTYATTTGNGNVYGVVGSATAANPLNNIGVYGEAKNATGYNTGMFGTVNSTTGIYNVGVSGVVTLNSTAVYNRGIAGYAPVAANHYAGYFDGNVDMQSGTLRIGNVTTPAGYKLYVEQGILTEKVKVALSSSLAWADYVFAKDYKLQPLAEVESFINTNKHLPNMPSATELAKEGLDLGKMQAKQMEKIEELTLYLIQMGKKIETLEKQNELLKSKN